MKAKFYAVISSSKFQAFSKVAGISMMMLAVGLSSGNVQLFDAPGMPV